MNVNELISRLNTRRTHPAMRQVQALPYSLKDSSPTSSRYYADIKTFTERWNGSLHPWLEDVLNPVQEFRRARGLPQRSFDELALELLALGVYLQQHGARAEHFPAPVVRLLRAIIHVEQAHPRLEPLGKSLRGILNGLFFLPDAAAAQPWSARSIHRLAAWLAVQGAEPQAQRFAAWLADYTQAGGPPIEPLLAASFTLVQKFAILSETYLGAYTRQVPVYRDQARARARWRYDSLLLNSSPLEYHLGMFATQVLNQAYRPAFQAARRKLVILPPCMCARPWGECLAISTPMGAQCGGCTPSCRVNQITRAAAQKGVSVVMVPDDQLGKVCLTSGQAGKGLGVVGAACALRNWGAGWESERLGLHGQGILLDSASCGKHWAAPGIPTGLDLQELLESF